MDLERRTDLYVNITFRIPKAARIPCEILSNTLTDIACGNAYEINVYDDYNGNKIWSEIGGKSDIWT